MNQKILDKKNRRLLYELTKNTRSSVASIAKALNSSRDSVNYRLKQLEEAGAIVRYHAGVDLMRLGFVHYRIMLKLRCASEAKMDEIIAFCVSQSMVTWVARYDGAYDIGICMRCREVSELSALIDQLISRFNHYLFRRTFDILVEVRTFGREYLIDAPRVPAETGKGSVPGPVTLDKVDLEILRVVSRNCRVSTADVARQIAATGPFAQLSREAVMYRIRHLEEKKILTGYWLVLNLPALNLMHYRVIVSVEHTTPKALKAFLDYCWGDPRVSLFHRTLGTWDYEFDLEIADINEGRKFMMDLTRANPNVVRDYTTLLVTKLEKWDISSVLGQLGRSDSEPKVQIK